MLAKYAKWASQGQLRRGGLLGAQGLILGMRHGEVVRHDGPEHLLIVAGTRKGKSTCFVLPNLLTWRESFVVLDPKDELYPVSAAWRSTFSRVVRLSPTSSTTERFNILDTIPLGTDQEIRGAQMVAEGLTDTGAVGSDHMSDAGQHFTSMAAEFAVGLLLYGLYTQRARSLGALNALLVAQDVEVLLKVMATYPHPAIQRSAWAVNQAGERGERGGIITTMTRALRLYTDPLIQRATDTSDFSLRDLRERAKPMTCYLTIPPSDRERLKPWTRLVMRQVIDYTTQHLDHWKWRMTILLDEFPLLDRINVVSDGLTYAAGYGVRFLLVTASMQQVIATYKERHPFFDGCDVKVAFGVDDAAARVFSQRVGEAKARISGPPRGKVQTEPLLSPTALTNLSDRQALVLVGRHKMLVKKLYYKDVPLWNARSQM